MKSKASGGGSDKAPQFDDGVPSDFPLYVAPLRVLPSPWILSDFEIKLTEDEERRSNRYGAWLCCLGLVDEFVLRCQRNETGKYRHLTREEILAQYCTRLLASRYGSVGEMRWVIRAVAQRLKWPVPENAIEP